MESYDFYNKDLTINKFSIFSEIPVGMILNNLEEKFPKKLFSGNSKLLLKEYVSICNTFYGSDENFKEKYYGKYLIQQRNKFNIKIEKCIDLLKIEFFNLLENSEILSKYTEIEKIDSLSILPLIKNEFVLTHRNKPGDDDSTFAFYDIRIGNYNIKKYLAYIVEYSSKPYEVYKKLKSEEAEIKQNIPLFNEDFCKTLTITKTLELSHIDFDKYFIKVLDQNKLVINSQNLNVEIENIKEEIISRQMKYNFHLFEKFDNESYFKIMKRIPFEEKYLINQSFCC